MPAKVKVRILAGRNLPVMDKSSDASDAFVEVKLGNTTYKTEVYRRSLNPFWNSEWFRFEVSDQELQDEPLQIRIMDYDTYSANDAIGKVYINLNPLLLNPGRSMNGWLPIYDTLHGIRGEINCMVKVNLFADNNQFRNSSCGVRFFFSDIPNGYKCDAILGFVDELLVNDDPEYQWIDKIRTPRASNEARQTLFTKLSGEVQRKLGLKAEVFGGNAVIGYQQSFDLEGGSGIVGRGIGTAVVLSKIGHQYEGVISPLVLCNPNYPYPYHNPTTRSQKNRSGNQFFSFHGQGHASERHLVHSVSADFFYEIPSRLKRLSNASPDASTLTTINRIPSEKSDNSDLDTFVSFQSDDDTDVDDNDQSLKDLHKSVSMHIPSSTTSSILLSTLSKSLSSNKIDESHRHNRQHKQRKSSLSLLSKILPKNDSIIQKLTEITRPASQTTTVKLIKKLSYRTRIPQNSSATAAELQNNKPSQNGDHPLDSRSTKDTSQATHSKLASLPKAQSLNTSTTVVTSSSPSPNSVVASTIAKRKKEKCSTATSVDDALSIIEEKLDDDDISSRPSTEQQSRARLLSSSSSRPRRFTRSREIDLSGESEPSSLIQTPTVSNLKGALSQSSAEEDEIDVNLVGDTASKSTLESRTNVPIQSESTLSTSSPSVSVLTDDTIKMNPEASASKLTLPNQKTDFMRRSDTDVNRGLDLIDKRIVNENNIPQSSKSLVPTNHVDSKRTSPDCKRQHSLMQPNQTKAAGCSPNFIQSVRVIKAQQHLLQNMIKHQNQNLVTSSMNKAKNAFMYPSRIYQSEYPFVTLKRYPEDLIQCTGGVVSAHSVKLLDHIINDEESETRDIWWTEIRKEVRSHAKALNCNTILGYSETSKVLGDVCILSARGTAAVMKPMEQFPDPASSEKSGQKQVLKVPQISNSPTPPTHSSMPPRGDFTNRIEKSIESMNQDDDELSLKEHTNAKSGDQSPIDCSFCHTPLVCVESISSLANCTICNACKVPDVLLLTIEAPKNLNIVSTSTLVQARVCRAKRDSHGEASAKEIGDALPFLEYELHRQLFSKLKFKSLNCLFNLSVDISIGETMITGVATGTGCFVLGLPTPEMPQISAGKGIKATKLNEIKRLLSLSAVKNRQHLGLDQIELQLSNYRQQVLTTDHHGSPAQSFDRSEVQHDAVISTKNSNRQNSDASASGAPSSTLAPTIEPASSTTAYTSCGDISDDNKPSEISHSSKPPPTRLVSENSTPNKTRRNYAASSGNRLHNSHGHKHHHGHKHNHHHHRHHHHHHHHKKSSRTSVGPLAPAENLINLLGDDNNIVLEVDDNEDADIIALLIDSDIPDGYLVCNSETAPSINQCSITSINMFTQVMRVKLSGLDQFAQQFDWILQALMVKQRRSLPCCLAKLNFVVDLPEAHVVQITMTGSVLGLRSERETPSNTSNSGPTLASDIALESGPGVCNARPSTSSPIINEKKHPRDRVARGSSTSMSAGSLSPSSDNNNHDRAPNNGNNTTLSPSESSESGRPSSSSSSSTTSSPSSTSTTSSSSETSDNEHGNQKCSPTKQQQPEPGLKSSTVDAKQTTPSLTKQLSKGNIAALISAGKSTFNDMKAKSSSKSSDKIELNNKTATIAEPPTTKATIAAVQHELLEIDERNLDPAKNSTTSKRPARSLRAVFKKQQTYPGAISPAISGQDNVLADFSSAISGPPNVGSPAPYLSNNDAQSFTPNTGSVGGKTAAKRASDLLNRVKQPLKDLGSNFNTSLPASASTSTKNSLTLGPPVSPSLDVNWNPQTQPTGSQIDPLNHVASKQSTKHHKAPSLRANRAHVSSKNVAQHHAASSTSSFSLRADQPRASSIGASLLDTNGQLVAAKASMSGAATSLNSNIDITSLSYIPGAKEYHYLGNLTFSFVRETNSVRENGGLNGFIHCFLMEVYAIVRAHVSALGGNAFLSFRMQQSCIFYHSNKNQAQCLISVAGDAVQVNL